MKTKEMWGTITLAIGLAMGIAGCSTPCGTCGNPPVVRERVVQTDECIPSAPPFRACDRPCNTTPRDIGLDGW